VVVFATMLFCVNVVHTYQFDLTFNRPLAFFILIAVDKNLVTI